jgi:hypothetical protein
MNITLIRRAAEHDKRYHFVRRFFGRPHPAQKQQTVDGRHHQIGNDDVGCDNGAGAAQSLRVVNGFFAVLGGSDASELKMEKQLLKRLTDIGVVLDY